VIPLALLGVIVQQLLDAGLDESELGKDLVGGGGPDDGSALLFQWAM
jgi:hypothetical protein